MILKPHLLFYATAIQVRKNIFILKELFNRQRHIQNRNTRGMFTWSYKTAGTIAPRLPKNVSCQILNSMFLPLMKNIMIGDREGADTNNKTVCPSLYDLPPWDRKLLNKGRQNFFVPTALALNIFLIIIKTYLLIY